MSELMIAETVNAVQVFKEGQLDDLLSKIEKEARTLVPDLSTDKGRKEIASMAHKVARSKTYLDDQGKALVADQKAAIKLVDAERKRMRDHLDALKAEVRRPLTEWEQAEAARVEKHKAGLGMIQDLAPAHGASADELSAAIAECEGIEMGEHWDEFAAEAARLKDQTLAHLREALTARRKADAEAAELERLRKEQAEREEAERQERIAREAAERAEAEAKRREEAERAAAEKARQEAAEREERLKREAAEAEERHAREMAEAEERAKREAEEAAERERARIEAEKQAEAEAQRRRELDAAHRKSVKEKAMAALTEHLDIDLAMAGQIVTLIESDLVPSVIITY